MARPASALPVPRIQSVRRVRAILCSYLVHLVATALAWVRYGRIDFMFGFPPSLSVVPSGYPADYGYYLLQVYLVWAAIVCALYPLCRWFADVKARNRSPVLSYL